MGEGIKRAGRPGKGKYLQDPSMEKVGRRAAACILREIDTAEASR
jgi:hypothetical protein